jgi:hypothetical protein
MLSTRRAGLQPRRRYFAFLDEALTALALLEASFFFWFLTAESCFLALSLAFGDLSPMSVPPAVRVTSPSNGIRKLATKIRLRFNLMSAGDRPDR